MMMVVMVVGGDGGDGGGGDQRHLLRVVQDPVDTSSHALHTPHTIP